MIITTARDAEFVAFRVAHHNPPISPCIAMVINQSSAKSVNPADLLVVSAIRRNHVEVDTILGLFGL
ncbi:hypothetical protein FEAC_20870 [Ferrimicrobium acidiphilum DSM 19497]|uniref:Uncharacterized protein n=1 Tax=Ferrimicrobium acidiphilum DSM 19497 TaxID=1121877 RepID=A0A0D8FSI4_9ACTN|nr:hypothetical protein [Ferrimicrobium acidiphilum]KJE76225.1 hypothetical protein FEAC_20870 [Ferrimicrobium acidiphilum DSM 19497]